MSSNTLKPATYLEAFKNAANTFVLAGNRMLVERLDSGEVKTKGGIIMAEAPGRSTNELKTHKPLVCVVIAVGEGYTGEEVDAPKIPLDCKPGNIVVLNAIGVSFFSTLPGIGSYTEMKVGLTTEGDVQMRFRDINQFDEYVNAVSGTQPY